MPVQLPTPTLDVAYMDNDWYKDLERPVLDCPCTNFPVKKPYTALHCICLYCRPFTQAIRYLK